MSTIEQARTRAEIIESMDTFKCIHCEIAERPSEMRVTWRFHPGGSLVREFDGRITREWFIAQCTGCDHEWSDMRITEARADALAAEYDYAYGYED